MTFSDPSEQSSILWNDQWSFQVEANWTATALLEHNYKDLATLMFLSLCVVDLVFHFSGG